MGEQSSPAQRIARVYGEIVTAGLALFGGLGLLRSGLKPPAESLFTITLHPISSAAYLALGLIGISVVARARWAPGFALFIGGVLVAWAIASLVLDGSPNDVFSGDRALIGLNTILGLAGLIAGSAERWLPARLVRRPVDSP